MTTAIGTFIRFLNPINGDDLGVRFQNFFARDSKEYKGLTYLPQGFGFSGSAVDIEAANIQAELVFPLQTGAQNTLQLLQNACNNYFVVEVDTVWLNPDTLAVTDDRMSEVYSCTSFSHDTLIASLNLASPLDAVTANVPRRNLSQRLVGYLPTTGNVSFV